ncbi:hypothetical protein C2R22_05850 [Salinigranum rubrum]|uniref:Uncharacterized protein n=1 Tax=Salinigranum rubrum TaxID=755307 RepID=A0A2I8VH41_9EURY|nr:hypothetical protein [Salinigranum rubrum]AUV81241.1 hypothetical protein C2R22_05850 [Salinigranum rubrum]
MARFRGLAVYLGTGLELLIITALGMLTYIMLFNASFGDRTLLAIFLPVAAAFLLAPIFQRVKPSLMKRLNTDFHKVQ